MKQRGDGLWSGHRDITYAAVARLYQHLAAPHGTINGFQQQEYADLLDRAQAYQDRAVGAGVIQNFGGTGKSMPYAGLGPTGHSGGFSRCMCSRPHTRWGSRTGRTRTPTSSTSLRLALEHGVLRPGPSEDEVARLSGVLAPNAAPAKTTPATGHPHSTPASVSRRITSEGVGRGG